MLDYSIPILESLGMLIKNAIIQKLELEFLALRSCKMGMFALSTMVIHIYT